MVEHRIHSLTVTRVRDSSSSEVHSEETITRASNPNSHMMEPAAGLVCKTRDQECEPNSNYVLGRVQTYGIPAFERKSFHTYICLHIPLVGSQGPYIFFFSVHFFSLQLSSFLPPSIQKTFQSSVH